MAGFREEAERAVADRRATLEAREAGRPDPFEEEPEWVPPLPLASWPRRVAAQLIDQAIVLPVAIGGGLLLFEASGGLGFLAIYLGAPIAYYGWLHSRSRGQTLGKLFLRIAVKGMKGERLTLGRSVGRVCALLGIGFVPIFGLVNAFRPLWNTKKQGFHDSAVGTIVVRRLS